MAQSKAFVDGPLEPILPLGRRVAIRPSEAPEFDNKSGIILPAAYRDRAPSTGIVVCLGDECYDVKMVDGKEEMVPNVPIREGMRVAYSVYSGVEFQFQGADKTGNRIMIIDYEGILGIVQTGDKLDEEHRGHWNAAAGQARLDSRVPVR